MCLPFARYRSGLGSEVGRTDGNKVRSLQSGWESKVCSCWLVLLLAVYIGEIQAHPLRSWTLYVITRYDDDH